MDFAEKGQASIIVEKLSSQREAAEFCDIVLVVQGQKIYAHRNVLAACSGYFNSEFKKHKVMKEKMTFPKCKNVEAFQSILTYMYTGLIVIDWSNVSDLLSLAKRFLVEKVTEYCKLYLYDHMNTNNCFSIHNLSIKYELKELQTSTSAFVQQHIIEILEQKEVLQFNMKKLQQFLDEYEFHESQLNLLHFFCKWVEFKIDLREHNFETLLTRINWESVNQANLEESINGCSLLKNNSKCMYFLLNYLEKQDIHIHSHEERYDSLNVEFKNIQNREKLTSSKIKKPPPDSSKSTSKENIEVVYDAEVWEKDSYKVKDTPGVNLVLQRRKTRRKSSSPQKIVDRPINLRKRKNVHRQSAILVKPTKKLVVKKIKSKVQEGDNCDSGKSISSDSDTSLTKSTKTSTKRRGRKLKKDPMWKAGVKCDRCSFISHTPSRMESHVSRVHTKEAIYKCNQCDETFAWSRDYSEHLKVHFSGPPFQCKECKFETDKIFTLLYHLFKHTNDRPFTCDQCGHKSISQSKLDYHMRTHTGERPYACSQCDLKFKEKRVLMAHLFIHTKEKMFLCDVCGFGTRHKKLLVTHMRTHTGDVYSCDYPDCKFSAPMKCLLKRHQKSHAGIRSYICSYCGAGFILKNYLTNHERIHLNENPFKCEHCDYSSCRKGKLREHIQKHHSNPNSSKESFRPRKQRLMRMNEDGERSREPKSNITNLQPVSWEAQNNVQPAISNNSSSNSVINHPLPVTSNAMPISLNYDCHSHAPVQQHGAIYNYQATCNQVVNLPYMGPSLPPPVISHEMPTKFNSFMSFM